MRFDAVTDGVVTTLMSRMPDHVYMLIGYDSTTDRFHLFNPWGYGAPYPAELMLSYTELVASFVQTTSTIL